MSDEQRGNPLLTNRRNHIFSFSESIKEVLV